jgi:diguanylate cyclase (GGDEF)-like protein
MRIRLLSLMALALCALLADPVAAGGEVVPVAGGVEGPLGRHVTYLQESGGRLSVAEVAAARRRGKLRPGRNPILAFGIGAPPVWIHLRVFNDRDGPVTHRIAVDTAWLDRVQVFVRRGGATVAAYAAGDRQPFARRPLPERGFVFPHAFAPGVSHVYLRVATPDPMVVPLYLEAPRAAADRQAYEAHSYGFLYGFLVALLAYNLMLFAGLREARFLLYSLYLGLFLLMNLSYTGHAYQWLWPDSPVWAQWSQPTLMMAYAASGLAFALSFLGTRRRFPRLHRAVIGYVAAGGALLALAALFGLQEAALRLAFVFVTVFTGIMVVLGVVSVRAGVGAARYFLAASVFAMAGAAVTALAVWGAIPFTTATYRAVDAGMLLDATLLALALTYQFRVAREQRARAEELARLDPLTGVNNRRAFHDLSTPLWNLAKRHDRPLAVILLDIDRFKRINDAHGHAGGDEAIKATAEVLRAQVRDQDVIARWGGEEFILLLPETDRDEALALADRLRGTIAASQPVWQGRVMALTASLGLAEKGPEHRTLEDLILAADRALFEAKAAGRDRVAAVASAASPPSEGALRAPV